MIDLEKRAAGIAWMQLHARVLLLVELEHFAQAELRGAPLHRLVVAALQDHHVAAVAAAALEVAARGGAVLNRCDDFDELPAHREDRVVKPELADAGIDVTDLEPEHGAEIRGDAVAILRHQRDLS